MVAETARPRKESQSPSTKVDAKPNRLMARTLDVLSVGAAFLRLRSGGSLSDVGEILQERKALLAKLPREERR
jgi:hypothetical protein